MGFDWITLALTIKMMAKSMFNINRKTDQRSRLVVGYSLREREGEYKSTPMKQESICQSCQ